VATLLTHGIFGVAFGQAGPLRLRGDWRFWSAAVFCSMLPDVDVVGFRFGIRYGDLWGHRGMTHSLLFAAIIGLAVGVLLARSGWERWAMSALFFLITASHGVLDAMTDGGLGVAFFSPFDSTRYFLPWRPIHVSPLGVHSALSVRVISVLRSEIMSVWVPALFIGVILYLLRKRKRKVDPLSSA